MHTWNPKANDIFLKAVEIEDTENRAQFVAESCDSNLHLQSQVEELLQAAEQAATFLERPASEVEASFERSQTSELLGTLIGPYKLREQLGEGGMGIVYAAEQEQPVRRKVALKVIKPGMDSREVIGRFEAERQALAMMDHQNIARVLDGGTTESGLPYFVMELVRGVTVTEYCDKNRLTICERLELFMQICKAVQHAHQKGIIHRDIKPSNVMVTLHDGVPVPKVIDFGVAKAINQRLTEETVYTKVAQMLGTPAYMSPEQAELSGLDIDTRSDIYSLGVMLYELLAGSTPFTKEQLSDASFDEMRRVIRETDPQRPSERISTLQAEAISTVANDRSNEPRKLSNLLRGELDWIVMRALEKDRTRRYETASALAEDVQRYLHDEPVVACPPSPVYRFRKFARRNKVSLAFSLLVAIAMATGTAGLAISNYQISQREEAKQTAENQADASANRMAIINDFVIKNIIESANPLLEDGSRGITVRESLLAANNRVDDAFKDDLELMSLVKSNFGHYFLVIGELGAARQDLEDALGGFVELYGKENRHSLFAMRELTQVYWELGELELALSTAKNVVALLESLNEKLDADSVESLFNLGVVLGKKRQFAKAEQTLHETIACAQAGEFYLLEGMATMELGTLSFHQQDYAEAEAHWLTALAVFKEQNSDYNTILANYNLTNVYWETGRTTKAIKVLETVLDQLTEVVGPTDPQTLRALHKLAGRKFRTGDLDSAVDDYRLLLTRAGSRYGPEHETLAEFMLDLGTALRNAGEFKEALELQQLALESVTAKFGNHHVYVMSVLGALAITYSEMGDIDNASKCYRQAIEGRLAIVDQQPDNSENIVSLCGVYCNLGNLLTEEKGKPEEALEFFTKAIDMLEKANQESPTVLGRTFLANTYCGRADALGLMQQWETALTDFDKAILHATTSGSKDEMWLWKARLLAMSGDVVAASGITEDVLTRATQDDDENYFLAARVLGLCAGKSSMVASNNPSSPLLFNEFATRGVQVLAQTDEYGYFRYPTRIDELHQEHDFDAIRDLPLFKEFVKQLELEFTEPEK